MSHDAAGETGATLEERIKTHARALGFDLVGITTLGPAPTAPQFDAWLEAGYAGEMAYLATGATKRHDTRLPFDGVNTAIVVGMNYGGTEPPGPVARYARGDDYHDVMVAKLHALHEWLRAATARDVRGKAYVDTGPVLERDLARQAGLGWFGKNTNLLNPALGSFFFLGALFVDVELAADAPFDADRCGTCTRCLDACPTDALVAPGTLDATRCISYLTIENKGPVAEPLRALVGDLVYGCDICQDVCPYNRKFARELPAGSPFRPRAALSGRDARTLARELLAMSQAEFSVAFKGSPMKRAKLRGLQRNAAVVLGNVGTPDDRPSLTAALSAPEPLVREHAAWALGRLDSSDAPGSRGGIRAPAPVPTRTPVPHSAAGAPDLPDLPAS